MYNKTKILRKLLEKKHTLYLVKLDVSLLLKNAICVLEELKAINVHEHFVIKEELQYINQL